MSKLLILFSICLIGFGCDKDHLGLIAIPDNVELDVDQDGSIDFVVTYSQRISGDPAGNYEEVRMNLQSEGLNQILKNEDEFPIFLNDIDLIQTEVALPLFWEITNPASNISTPIAAIRTDYDGTTWDDEWSIFSFEEKDTYLIGVKLLRDSSLQIGFIEFSVEPQTGAFTLVRTEIL